MNNQADLRQQEVGAPILRPVEVLKGVRAIASFLSVSQTDVLEMEERGAPIKRKNGVLRAEKAELWDWWKRD